MEGGQLGPERPPKAAGGCGAPARGRQEPRPPWPRAGGPGEPRGCLLGPGWALRGRQGAGADRPRGRGLRARGRGLARGLAAAPGERPGPSRERRLLARGGTEPPQPVPRVSPRCCWYLLMASQRPETLSESGDQSCWRVSIAL